MATNKNKHLTQDDRNVIAIGIVNGSSKKAIADNLGKDKSTIGKEIRAHRYLSHKSTLSLECENTVSLRERIVLSTALIILSSAVNAEIVLRELVMAVRN